MDLGCMLFAFARAAKGNAALKKINFQQTSDRAEFACVDSVEIRVIV
jgi:hypothetical protein